jgi:hypothetical protein
MGLHSDRRSHRRDFAEVTGGLLVGIVVTLIVGSSVISPDSGAGGTHQQARLSAQRHASSQQAAADLTRRCVDAATATLPPLRRAASSIDQWEVHVGAMNKLVTGVITLQQASAFWNRTRMGASQRIERFDRAWARLKQHGLDCPPTSRLPSGSSRQLRSCSREIAANMRVLSAAGTAIHTWRRHVGAMNMLRMGKISPSTASRTWLSMWQRGQREIATYRAAVRAAGAVPKCTA